MSITDVMVNEEIMKSKAYQTYLEFSTRVVIPKKARKGSKALVTPKKISSITAEEDIIPDPKEARRSPMGVIIRDTPNVSKKKTQDQSLKLKGMEMLSDAVLLEVDIRKASKANRHDYISQQQTGGSSEGADITPEVLDEAKGISISSNEGAGVTLEVPDVSKTKSVVQDINWGSDEDEIILSSSYDERTKSEKEIAKSDKTDEESDDDKGMHDDEEEHVYYETQEDKYVHDDAEKHDDADEEMHDAENTNKVKDDQVMSETKKGVSEKTKKEKVKDDQAGAIVFVTQKENNEAPPSSFSLSLSLNYGNQFVNLSPDGSLVDEDDIDRGVAEPPTQKNRRHDDKDQDPSVRSDQRMKKRKKSEDTKPSKRTDQSGLSKGTTQSQPTSTSKHVQAKETVYKAADTDQPLDHENDISNDNDQTDVEVAPNTKKSIWFKQPRRPETPDLEWNQDKAADTNPEGDKPPYDLSKPLPLQGSPGHLAIHVDFFFNNDLEYLKTKNSKRKYTVSITKTKAARYELKFIEEMIPRQWSPVKVAYNRNPELGICHWGPKRQLFYRSQINRISKHDVYSTMKILSVVSVKVDKRRGYGYLEEIIVRRADQKLYTFKEGGFPRLHLNDIKDMLLLYFPNKLFNLEGDDIVNLAVALHMSCHQEKG
nr:hypothetical protein [Tanacetum cinerariifolium]